MSVTPSPLNPYKCKTLFVSDLHMGSYRFDADLFTRFLASYDPDTIYLVGDIIDGWKLRKRWHWPLSYVRSTSYLLSLAQQGKNIFYIMGNHDDRLRLLPPVINKRLKDKYGFQLLNKHIHTTEDGRKLLVIHGDQFDWKILHGRLSKWGDSVFDFITTRLLSTVSPRVRVKGKYTKFSLSKAVRKSGTHALYLLKNFEKAVLKRIEKDKVNGLICGHTHVPVQKELAEDKLYINTGSWMADTPTALIEHEDGRFELIFCNPQAYMQNANNQSVADIPFSSENMEKAKRLEEWVKHLWYKKFKIARLAA